MALLRFRPRAAGTARTAAPTGTAAPAGTSCAARTGSRIFTYAAAQRAADFYAQISDPLIELFGIPVYLLFDSIDRQPLYAQIG